MNEPKNAIRAGNAMMRARILQMPPPAFQDNQPAYRVVELRGRSSGAVQQVPLAVFQHAGQRYLIAPTRERDWVLNLAAAGECVLLARDIREDCTAQLVEDDAAIAAAQAYRRYIGNGMTSDQFLFGVNATPDEIRTKLPMMAVFRLRAKLA